MKRNSIHGWLKKTLVLVLAFLLMTCVFGASLAEDGTATPDPLVPGPVTSTDGYITLNKYAERTGPEEWTVHVQANVKDITVDPAKLEVVFVLDCSSTMNACALEENHFQGGGTHICDPTCPTPCPFTSESHVSGYPGQYCYKWDNVNQKAVNYETRYDIAKKAISSMVSNLPGNHSVKYAHFAGWSTNPENGSGVEDNLDNLPQAYGQTYLYVGVQKGIGAFSDHTDSKKVLVIVTDGAASDGNYATNELNAFKNNGGTVFTVGFNHTDENLVAMASEDGGYFRAGSEDALVKALDSITSTISTMVIDPMGTNVNFDITEVEENSNLSTHGNTIFWRPVKDPVTGKFPDLTGQVVDYTYTVALNEAANRATGTHTDVPLNGTTTFRYGITTGTGDDAVTEMYDLNFLIPHATYAISSVQANWVDENGLALPVDGYAPTAEEKVISDHSDDDYTPAFTKTNYQHAPAQIDLPDGSCYQYQKTEVTADGTLLDSVDDVDATKPVAYVVTHIYKKVVPGVLSVTGTKYIDGLTFDNDKDEKGEDITYTFELKGTGSAPLPEGASGSKKTLDISPESGNSAELNFGTINFTAAGEYEYEIRETASSGNKHRVARDKTEYKLIVTVDDNLNVSTSLKATLDEVTTDTNEIVFRNVYPTTGTLTLKKVLEKAASDENGFTFHITTENDTYREDVKNWADKNSSGAWTYDETQKALIVTTGAMNAAEAEIILNKFPTGTYTVTEVDADGYAASYQVNSGEASEKPASVTFDEDEKKTVTVTNTVLNGSLLINKTFEGLPDSIDRSGLRFAIAGPDGYSKTIPYADFTNGTYTLEDLPAGRYTVTETNADDLAANYTLDSSSVTSGTADVPRGAQATVQLKNVYTMDTVEASAGKAWKNADGSTAAPDRASVVFTLYANDKATDYTVTLDGTPDTAPTTTGGYESEAWTASFVNLPKATTDTNAVITYTIAETTGYPGYTASTTEPVADGETITNTQDVTEVFARKAWINADGTSTAPEGAKVTFTLYADGKATEHTVTLDGTPDTAPTTTGGYESAAWTASFVNLPKTTAGTNTEITYTVAESTGYAGYTAYPTKPVADGETITNTQEKTDVIVGKLWENIDGTTTAPKGASVVFTLYADDVPTKHTVTLNGVTDTASEITGDYEYRSWQAYFVNLPKMDSATGKKIVYTVAETKGYPGYTASPTKPVPHNTRITNKQEKTEVSVHKAWVNVDGTTTAPAGATVEFTLYADDKATSYTVTLDGTVETEPTTTGGYESKAWTARFVNLPKTNSTTGEDIVYTVAETEGYTGYTATPAVPVAANKTITNTQDETEVSVTKAWVNADGTITAPESATVVFTLYANGNATSYTVTLDGTVDTVPTTTGGYESEAWTALFVNLPKVDSTTGEDIVYTVAETEGYTGYTATPAVPVAANKTITNTQDETAVSVTKAWVNADGTTTAPESATVVFTLYANGNATSYTVTLDGTVETEPTTTGGYESEAWTATFVNLPKTTAGTNTEITYTIAETTGYPGYTASTTDPVGNGATITNTQSETAVFVHKAWVNADGSTTAPDGATVVFTLYADDEATAYTVTLDGTVETEPTTTGGYESEAWTATFVNLPKTTAGTNTEITYTIAETTGYPGYTASTTDPVGSGATITNTQIETAVSVHKAWVNADGSTTAPEGATVLFALYANGEPIERSVMLDGMVDEDAATDTGYESEGWTALFVNLPKVDSNTGEDIVYTVAEVEGYPGYTASPAEPVTNGATITNIQNEVSVSAGKAWSNADGSSDAPENAAVTFRLYADGSATGLSTVLDGTADQAPEHTGAYESAPWIASFVHLPERFGDGDPVIYTVAEAKGYTGYKASTTEPVGDGATITNTQDETEVSVTKAWVNADGTITAPEGATVVFTLYANGEETAYTVTLDGAVETEPTTTGGYESEAWTALFVNLPKVDSTTGEDIVYTVAEAEGYPGYTASTTDPVGSGATITNTEYVAIGSLTLTASKTVNGMEPAEDEVFSFELTNAAGDVLQTVQNVKGDIVFDALDYTYTLATADTSYLYTVREKQETRSGYTLDQSTYFIAVTLEDQGDGTLTVNKTIVCDGQAVEAMTFDNTYAAEGTLELSATKLVNGSEPREDQVYAFVLSGEDEEMLAQNAQEEITFDALSYDLTDAGKTYTYTVKETTPSTDQLTVDSSIYTVEVTVTDNRDGTLTATPVITKDGVEVEEIVFENKLTAPLIITNTVEDCVSSETFRIKVKLFDENGVESTETYACNGDAEGELKSGDVIELAHGQSVTITGLRPGMSYVVEEEAKLAFTTTVNGVDGLKAEGTLPETGSKVDFVNKLKTTTFTVTKIWRGGGGGPIELVLYANGEKMQPQPDYSRDGDVYEYANLPVYNKEDQLIVYSAKEKYVDGFLTIYNNVYPHTDKTKAVYDGGTIINKFIVKADFSVKKTWRGLAEGEKAPAIQLVLYCNGVATDVKTPIPNSDGWYKYYNLPGEVDGVKAVYTVQEVPVDGYITSYTLADGTSAEYANHGGTITNSKIPQTSDKTPLTLWLMLMGASAMMMLFLKRRKA